VTPGTSPVDDAADAVSCSDPLPPDPRCRSARAIAEAADCSGRGTLRAGISRFASTHDGLRSGAIADPRFEAIVEGTAHASIESRGGGTPGWFTLAYLHRPDELLDEVRSRVPDAEIYAVEGSARGWISTTRSMTRRARHRAASHPSCRAGAQPPRIQSPPHGGGHEAGTDRWGTRRLRAIAPTPPGRDVGGGRPGHTGAAGGRVRRTSPRPRRRRPAGRAGDEAGVGPTRRPRRRRCRAGAMRPSGCGDHRRMTSPVGPASSARPWAWR